MVMADIPGLIEGASEGIGLGFEFLRHIQRTRILIHVLDGLSEDVYDYQDINAELDMFDERLGNLPQIVVLNKMDLPDVEAKYEELKARFSAEGVELMPISAVTHLNLRELMWKAWHRLQELPTEPAEVEFTVYRSEEDPNAFEIEQVEDGCCDRQTHRTGCGNDLFRSTRFGQTFSKFMAGSVWIKPPQGRNQRRKAFLLRIGN